MWSLLLCALCLLAYVSCNVIVYTTDIPHAIAEEFQDLPASFGGDLPSDGLRGFLVLGNPPQGCTDLQKPPNVTNFTGKWIVLVARYNCSFETKIRNAQKAGYDCAIVHNVNSSELETMSAKNADDITIPSVFVKDVAGLILAQEYQYPDYYIMVNGDLPFNINTHLLLPFAIVVALCLLVMLIFMIVKCIKDRRRARRHRLPNRALKKIPTCKFAKGDPYDTCAICLDDYQDGDRLRVLPCAHAYHAKCIDPWLTQNKRVCPVCKRRVFAAGERRRVDTDSDSDDSREPLVGDPPPTQGGTFEEQRENPFVRAARFMTRLRGRNPPPAEGDTEEAQATEESNQNSNDAIEQDEDTQPLIEPTVASERERGARRSRRPRSASAPRPRAPALLHSAEHSINRERGEIGVAALPAGATPPHLRL